MPHENDFIVVALAGLLHDIGKFVLRSKYVKSASNELKREIQTSGQHPILSGYFINKDFKKAVEDVGLDSELLKTLVQHHHENPRYFSSDCLVSSVEDNWERLLCLIISRADNYSSSERDDSSNDPLASYKNSYLDCIFSRVNFSDSTENRGTWKYRPSEYSSENLFPEPSPSGFFEHLVEEFGREVSGLSVKKPADLVAAVTNLLHKYVWAVPSSIMVGVKDVSLFDHLKTTSAISACLYKYHQATDTLTETDIKNEKTDKFMLIGGDLSGIQNYIYDVAEVGTGGVAKRLRARSFGLSLFMEATALKILKDLKLPYTCLLFCSGGRFYILASNDELTQEQLKKTEQEIQGWVLNRYIGQISISIANYEFSPAQFSADLFKEVWNGIQRKIQKEKLNKFNRILMDDKGWSEVFLFEKNYNDSPEGVCRACHKLPAVDLTGKFDEGKSCWLCTEDLKIGTKLPNLKAVAYLEGDKDGDISFYDSISIKLIQKQRDIPTNSSLVVSYDSKIDLSSVPGIQKGIANYVARFKEKNHLAICSNCKLNKNCDYKDEITDRTNPILSFACLAAQSEGENEEEGAKLVGVLKADVDNLGHIFSDGIKLLTISRLTTLSNFLDSFFTEYLPKMLEEKFPNTYLVYAGGDDLLLLGAWDKIVECAGVVTKEFERFVAGNPEIHLSSAVTLSKPKFPFSSVAKFSSELLEQTKDMGRNRLAILSSVFEWSEFDQLLDVGKRMSSFLSSEEGSTGLIYRLLSYKEMFKRAKSGDTSGLVYLSRLSYDLRRNFYDKDDEPKDKDLEEIFKLLLDYEEGKELMENIGFPVSYALLRNRGVMK